MHSLKGVGGKITTTKIKPKAVNRKTGMDGYCPSPKRSNNKKNVQKMYDTWQPWVVAQWTT